MDTTNTTNEGKYLGKPLTAAEKRKYAKRHQDAILALHGIAPVKTRRAPRQIADKYIVLTSTSGGDAGPSNKYTSLGLARRGARYFLSDKTSGLDLAIASICKIEDEDMALEIWGIKDGKVVQVA